MRPARVRHVVEELEGVQESQQRLVRVRAQVADVARIILAESDLRHGRRRVGDVDAGDADRLGLVRACVNRSHLESDAAEADAGFIQPARAEGVSVVERQTLPANQTVSRAECRPGVAVR